MFSNCLKCRKNTESKNPNVLKTKKGRVMFSSKRVLRDSKKLRFIKEQEARWLIISLLGIELPFEGVHILGSII